MLKFRILHFEQDSRLQNLFVNTYAERGKCVEICSIRKMYRVFNFSSGNLLLTTVFNIKLKDIILFHFTFTVWVLGVILTRHERQWQ